MASRNEDSDPEGPARKGWCGCSMRAEDREGRQESKAGSVDSRLNMPGLGDDLGTALVGP